jgi:hypothetical protein
LLVLTALAVLTAGCGSSPSGAKSVANCLNGQGFLVEPRATTIEGASPGGVTFTLTLYKTAAGARAAGAALNGATTLVVGLAVLDFKGNAPVDGRVAKLATADAAIIRSCLAENEK